MKNLPFSSETGLINFKNSYNHLSCIKESFIVKIFMRIDVLLIAVF